MKTLTPGLTRLFSCTALGVLLLSVMHAYAQPQPDSGSQVITPGPQSGAEARPYVKAANAVEAGRYLAIVAGCNDCHTEGYLQTEGRIAEEDWFTGSKLGWRGPWGTTYPANLRLRVQETSEDAWVNTIHNRHANPPMPWMNVNRMSGQDARALYRYLKSFGPKGEHAPHFVPPEQEPSTAYISLEPQNPGGSASN